MNTKEIIDLENKIQLDTYAKYPLAVVKGEGCVVYDAAGKTYVDLYGGHAVCLTGHCHPRVVAAIAKQASDLLFYSNAVYSEVRARACRELLSFAPPGQWRVFLCNSGTEANETAMKIARRYTNRTKVLSMDGSFHGRTIGSLSATFLPGYRDKFAPLVSDHESGEFGSIPSLEEKLDDRTAAAILEPIQSMGGVRIAAPEYYRQLRRLCSERGALWISDEIQTAVGRTGKPFAVDHWGVAPDLITMAKGLASGVPVGAVLVKKEIADTIARGEHGTTFGGGQLAMAAMESTLQVIREENLMERAAALEARLREGFAGAPLVKEVRGKGLLLGLDLEVPAKEMVRALLEKGYITGASALPNVLRLLPPLVLTDDQADTFIQVFKETAQDLK